MTHPVYSSDDAAFITDSSIKDDSPITDFARRRGGTDRGTYAAVWTFILMVFGTVGFAIFGTPGMSTDAKCYTLIGSVVATITLPFIILAFWFKPKVMIWVAIGIVGTFVLAAGASQLMGFFVIALL